MQKPAFRSFALSMQKLTFRSFALRRLVSWLTFQYTFGEYIRHNIVIFWSQALDVIAMFGSISFVKLSWMGAHVVIALDVKGG